MVPLSDMDFWVRAITVIIISLSFYRESSCPFLLLSCAWRPSCMPMLASKWDLALLTQSVVCFPSEPCCLLLQVSVVLSSVEANRLQASAVVVRKSWFQVVSFHFCCEIAFSPFPRAYKLLGESYEKQEEWGRAIAAYTKWDWLHVLWMNDSLNALLLCDILFHHCLLYLPTDRWTFGEIKKM